MNDKRAEDAAHRISQELAEQNALLRELVKHVQLISSVLLYGMILIFTAMVASRCT